MQLNTNTVSDYNERLKKGLQEKYIYLELQFSNEQYLPLTFSFAYSVVGSVHFHLHDNLTFLL